MLIALTLALAVVALVATPADAQTRFRVSFAPEVQAEPFSGRIYVFFSLNEEPRKGPNWFRPAPILAADVENLPPGEAVELSPSSAKPWKTLVFPPRLEPKSLTGMKAQAVIRFNPVER